MGNTITNAYLASAELAAAWREFTAVADRAMDDVRRWQAEHPDAPLLGVRGGGPWHGYGAVVTCFLLKRAGDPVPDGFSKPKPGSRALYPYAKKPSGQPWRELLSSVPALPNFTGAEFGVTTQTVPNTEGGWGSEWMCLPRFEVLGDDVYVTTVAPHPETPHLTDVRLSEYHRARESDADLKAQAEDD